MVVLGAPPRQTASRDSEDSTSSDKPGERFLALAKVAGREPPRHLVFGRLSDHRHSLRHMKGELFDSGRVVARNDVGVPPRPVHFCRPHPEGSAIDEHAAAPAFLDAFGEVLQPALKLAGRHFGGGIEPAQLDQVGGWAIEYLAPPVLIDLFSHSLTSSHVRRVRYPTSCLSRRASFEPGRPTRPSPPPNAPCGCIRSR